MSLLRYGRHPHKFRYRINVATSRLSRRIELPCTISITLRSRTARKTMGRLAYAQNTPINTTRPLSETRTAIELKQCVMIELVAE
jgi:hypothetical protein